MTMLEAAFAYAARGWHVFPLRPRGKIPPEKFKWADRATADADEIRRLWDEYPDANIGIACGPSGLCVLDVDSPSGETFLAHHDVPETLEAITGKGRHLYFSGAATSVNRVLGDDVGIDRKSRGGYVVAPPSVHESGRVYEFSDPDVPVAPAPTWFLEATRQPKPAQQESAESTDSPGANGSVGEGRRNEFLSTRAYSMRRSGMTPEEIIPALVQLNKSRCSPPLDRHEVETIARGKTAVAPEAAASSTTVIGSDLWFARRIAAEHGQNLKYVWEWKSWVAWQPDEGRWSRSSAAAAWSAAKTSAQRLLSEAQSLAGVSEDGAKMLLKAASRFMGKRGLDAGLSLAQSEAAVIAVPSDFDNHPYLLNCRNGTVNLRTGKMRPHSRDDMLTMVAGTDYEPEMETPLWDGFLARILPDADVLNYVHTSLGYSLIGSVLEHVIYVAWGCGANGKGVLFGTCGGASGEYGVDVPPAIMVQSGRMEHPTLLTTLKGARLAVASETPQRSRFDEAQLKKLTGGDIISARGMYENYYNFRPSHTLWLQTNHKPKVKETSFAFWRRLRLIPFTVSIPLAEQDRALPEKLKPEWPGILAWMVKGAVRYCVDGVTPPATVVAATREYETSQDDLLEFTEMFEPGGWISTKDLHAEYLTWAAGQGFKPIGRNTLTAEMKDDRGWIYTSKPRGFRVRRVSEGQIQNPPTALSFKEKSTEPRFETRQSPNPFAGTGYDSERNAATVENNQIDKESDVGDMVDGWVEGET